MVTLDDCSIWSEPLQVVFSLPGVMDLRGIKKDINNYRMGHERFPNRFGTVYVACDFCVRYWPADTTLLSDSPRFRSVRGWGDFKGREFMISPPPITIKKDLLSTLTQNYRPYFDSFFGWVNESIRIYGKQFYTPI